MGSFVQLLLFQALIQDEMQKLLHETLETFCYLQGLKKSMLGVVVSKSI